MASATCRPTYRTRASDDGFMPSAPVPLKTSSTALARSQISVPFGLWVGRGVRLHPVERELVDI